MALLVCGCASPSRGGHAAGGAGKSSPLVHLPADQAAHPSAHNEWWYVVGHLRSGKRRFGYELTIFKFQHVRPPGFSSPVTIYRTDAAVTDETSKQFHQKITYYFPSSGTFSARTLDARVGPAVLAGNSPTAMRLVSQVAGLGLSLTLKSRKPAMNVGGRGYLPLGNGYTYYYSLTDLATRGQLEIGGQKLSVSGISWLDHQWGKWAWSSIRGWTWMALQLNNGVQLSVFDFRGTQRRVRAASVLLKNGSLKTIRLAQILAGGQWQSPRTGATYPDRFTIPLPQLQARLEVKPTVPDQELTNPSDPRGNYWEGSGTVSGTWEGRAVSGLSYIELTGYTSR